MNESQGRPGGRSEGSRRAELARQFALDPDVVHLNHGGFGACPRPVVEAVRSWQDRIERHPSAVLSREYEHDALHDRVMARLGRFLGADPSNLVLVPGTTAGLNGVARSLDLRAGDEVLTTQHEYAAMRLLWEQVCADAGARLVEAPLPWRSASDEELVDALFDRVTSRTRLLYLSHITSELAIQLPLAAICRRARREGLLTVVDGAHGPGQVDLQLDELGVDVYVASGHKWLCGPRGTGFLYAAPDVRPLIQPALVSHGWTATMAAERFRWQGTRDPSPFLALPVALDVQSTPSWEGARRVAGELASAAEASVADALGIEPLGLPPGRRPAQMVAVPIPTGDDASLRRRLFRDHGVDVPVRTVAGRTHVRVSLQVYNSATDVERLVAALVALFRRADRGPLPPRLDA